MSGCSTPRGPDPITSAEVLLRERDRGERWARGIEGLVSSREDVLLEQEMARIAARLGASDGPRVLFFNPRSTAGTVPVFVLPGSHWYFSVRALRGLQYDNELAAAVAAARVLDERAFAGPSADEGGAYGIPEYSETDWRRVSARMVEMLYRAGFDPRGVPQFWRKSAAAWAGRSPDWIVQLQEEALAQISRRAPLLNPVVRTPEFGEIEKRLKQL